MSCPSKAELVRVAFGDVAPNDPVLHHLRGCTACATEERSWREIAALLHTAHGSEEVVGQCLGEMETAAIASRQIELLTADTKTHLSHCGACRARLADTIELLRAPEIAAEVSHLEQRAAPRKRVLGWTSVALLAAALAGVLLLPPLFRARNGARELRDSDATITKTVAPRVVAPLGSVRAVRALIWTSVPGATRYGIRLFASDGTLLWETETSDTTIMLPANVPLKAGAVYLAQVDAHTGWNRSAQSELAEFRINRQGMQ